MRVFRALSSTGANQESAYTKRLVALETAPFMVECNLFEAPFGKMQMRRQSGGPFS